MYSLVCQTKPLVHSFVVEELDRLGIAHDHCVIHPSCRLPTSYVVLSRSTGSRTIIHYRSVHEEGMDAQP